MCTNIMRQINGRFETNRQVPRTHIVVDGRNDVYIKTLRQHTLYLCVYRINIYIASRSPH